jgi:GNAT superfamily N-acetyltransferase
VGLPVLQTSAAVSPEDLLRFFHRTELDWSRQLAESEAALTAGTALASPDLPAIVGANGVLEASVPPEVSPTQAIDEAEQWFADRRARCKRWVPNPATGIAADRDRLASELLARGFQRQDIPILFLARATFPTPPVRPGITIVPGRASYAHVLELAAQQAHEAGIDADQSKRAMTSHLDDPSVHVAMALAEKGAVGTAGALGFVAVLPAGEVGRIADLFVVSSSRRTGIGTMLLKAALDFCGRAMFKHVLMGCPAASGHARSLLVRAGFVEVARFTEYAR